MKKFALIFTMATPLVATAVAVAPLSEYDLNQPVGWGAMPDFEVTGGEGGQEIVVTTEAEFDAAMNTRDKETRERDVPMIIYVKGEIEFKSMHTYHVKNKTILGLPGARIFSNDRTKKNSGVLKFTSGSGADSENIIIRNLTIQGAGAYDVDGDDALLFQGVKRVWVDHCTIGDGVDSSLDCNHESDYICISWCKFVYSIPPLAGGSGGSDDHRYCNTWGSSDKDETSPGHLNTTFANCWWDEGCMERCPRVRFGKVHIANCYYTNKGNHYSIGYGYKSNIYAENCWFADGVVVDKDYTDAKKGYGEYNLQIVNCHNSPDKKQSVGDIEYFLPSDYYEYEVFDMELVPIIVGNEQRGAGANLMVEEGKGVTGYVAQESSIDDIKVEKAMVTSREYLTPDGTRVSEPGRGLYMVREHLNDGTFRVRKVIY
ncbi:MAG: chromophore lyase [Muribaculaceae bacterium]|nr:chromophore lyase [Muribaculaceae bacterium]